MDKSEAINKLKEYKKLLSKSMVFDQMILFGSYAKDIADDNSDVDVAIVVDEISDDYFSTRPLLWKTRRAVDDRIEPILVVKSQDDSGFLKEIIKHGVVID